VATAIEKKKQAGLEVYCLGLVLIYVFLFFVFCITTCTARSTTMNHDQLRSTTIHYDPLRSTTILYDPLRSTTIHYDPLRQVEGTTDPSTVSCVDDDINNEGKGVHVSVLANSTHADPPSLVLFLFCVLCFSLSLSLPLSVADLKAGTTLLVPSYRVVRSFATPDTTTPETPAPVAAADVATASGPDGT
jgi:hypothetical protein